jgi:hypothetical protein
MTIRLRGFADHRRFQVDADHVSRTDAEIVVATHDAHTAILRPRYGGSSLTPPYPYGHEICHFIWDGELVGIARLYEDGQGDMTIVPGSTTYQEDYEHVPPRP